MMAKLKSPLAFAVLGVVISIALGAALCWRAAGPLIAAARAHPGKKVDTENKAKGWDFWTIEIENLSNELKEERARMHKQADLLDQREARVAAERKELATMREEIEGLRKEIAEKVISIRDDEAKNLRALSQTYANLTPRAAVAIIREMRESNEATSSAEEQVAPERRPA